MSNDSGVDEIEGSELTEARTDTTDWRPNDATPTAPPAATAAPAARDDDELPPDRYLNRELSWLDFNARVLALAAYTSLPL